MNFTRTFPANGFEGMSLLDYFASLSMQGMSTGVNVCETYEDMARIAYAQARAMMEERLKERNHE